MCTTSCDSTLYQVQLANTINKTHFVWKKNLWLAASVIFINENENENGEKRENNEFVNEN